MIMYFNSASSYVWLWLSMYIHLFCTYESDDHFQERRQWWLDHVKIVGWGLDGPQYDILKANEQPHIEKDEL